MIIKRKIFEKYDSYTFNIPCKSDDKILVAKGSSIKSGTDLIMRKSNIVNNSFYLPDLIGSDRASAIKYVTAIDGELVNEGAILAERVVAGGLNIKRLISPSDGVVDLSRIESGYLDILGEENSVILKSSFSGDIIEANPVEGLLINSSTSALDIKLTTENKAKGTKLFGEFVVLGDGKDLLLKAIGNDYHDKIVFVGKYLHASLLHDLFEKGASFVLTYSMSYNDFRKQGLPIGVLGGFGEIFCSEKLISKLTEMQGSFAIVDCDESQLFFLNNKVLGNKNESLFLYSLPGATVKSLSLANYAMLGTVIDIEEDGTFINVKWENGLTGMTNIGSVEFVSL